MGWPLYGIKERSGVIFHLHRKKYVKPSRTAVRDFAALNLKPLRQLPYNFIDRQLLLASFRHILEGEFSALHFVASDE